MIEFNNHKSISANDVAYLMRKYNCYANQFKQPTISEIPDEVLREELLTYDKWFWRFLQSGMATDGESHIELYLNERKEKP